MHEKYKLKAGWTKAKVIEKIKEHNDGTPAMNDGKCVYQNSKGNRCAIGCFIPNGHAALKSSEIAVDLVRVFPDLAESMPFENPDDLQAFQRIHDQAPAWRVDGVYTDIEAWLTNHVEE